MLRQSMKSRQRFHQLNKEVGQFTEYSNLLQSLWQEMDHYQCIQMKCNDDVVILKRLVEKDRIDGFLAGLNIEFDVGDGEREGVEYKFLEKQIYQH